MKELVIICAGAFGREVASYTSQCKGYGTEFTLKGFIDSDLNRLDKYDFPVKIIDTIDAYEPKENDVFICTIGDVKLKKRFIETISNKGGKFISLIHNSVVLSDNNVNIGVGCFIGPFCCISCDTYLHDHVTLNCSIEVGHDVVISDYAHLNTFVFLGGGAHIDREAILHPHAIVLPKAKVGHNAVVGAGSVVLKKVNPNTTVFGSPAKEIHI